MHLNDYTQTDYLTGVMMEFGRYCFTYHPPEDAVESDISMSISSEATLPQMLELFEAFLRAAGYQLDSSLTLVEETPRPVYKPYVHPSGERVPGSYVDPRVCDATKFRRAV